MVSGLLKFAVGSALGATVGAAIGVLMAPKSGEQTQADTASFIENARAEGKRAQAEAEAAATERFRGKVEDPTALATQS